MSYYCTRINFDFRLDMKNPTLNNNYPGWGHAPSGIYTYLLFFLLQESNASLIAGLFMRFPL